jgi:hypothetical protein
MGLDMNLYKKHYVKNWGHGPKEENINLTVKRDGKKFPFINTKKVTHIQEDVAYWRKDNHIHDWFVKNCQDGVDECQEAYVDPTKLKELLQLCIIVRDSTVIVKGRVNNGYSLDKNNERVYNTVEGNILEDSSAAEELLPTTAGFFFGGTDYDEYYMEGVKRTIKMLEEELSIEYGKDAPEYYYRSSW